MSVLKPRTWVGALEPPAQVGYEIAAGPMTGEETVGRLLADLEAERIVGAELARRNQGLVALVSTLVARAFDGAADVAEARAAVERTIAALAEAQAPIAPEPAELGGIARRMLAAFDAGAEGRVSIEGPALTLAADAARLVALALFDLAANAARHGALADGSGRVAVAWTREAGGLRLVWREAGRPRGVIQVGALLRRVDEALSGALTVEHAPDGLRAEILLPPRCVLPAAAGVRALVVEDSPLIAADVADILAEEGVEATIAADLAEARAALAQCRFDFALLDVSLRDGSSDTLLDLIDPGRVVIISGHAPETLPPAFAGLPLIAKPFSLDELVAVCRRYTATASGQSMR